MNKKIDLLKYGIYIGIAAIIFSSLFGLEKSTIIGVFIYVAYINMVVSIGFIEKELKWLREEQELREKERYDLYSEYLQNRLACIQKELNSINEYIFDGRPPPAHKLPEWFDKIKERITNK